jgi:hypothetical protein
MKMLFSSSDNLEVLSTRDKFSAAGIACEVRCESVPVPHGAIPFYPELWVTREGDFARALNLYRCLGVGFARRLLAAEKPRR